MSSAETPPAKEVADLRRRVLASLEEQGFTILDGTISPPSMEDKSAIRELHRVAVEHRVQRARPGLERYEKELVTRLAVPNEVNWSDFGVRLVTVQPRSKEELLFRWITLHWSIPVSSGYGRRLRFIVEDKSNGKVVGVIGLGDPVFGLRDRDQWIGWDLAARKLRLRNVADAFVLGAVPPYSYVLGGKLVAALIAADEVRGAWREKYSGAASRISGGRHDGELAVITTTSALGRSSVYNRLRGPDRTLMYPIGYTRGSGEFQFSDGLKADFTNFADRYCVPTSKDSRWGEGFRNRREVVKKVLKALALPESLIYHGIERQVFVAPLAVNSKAFLNGQDSKLHHYHQTADELTNYSLTRYVLPRVDRNSEAVHAFNPREWLLWSASER